MKRGTVRFLWRSPDAVSGFRAGVSLHSHTMHSREGLGFIPRYAGHVPLLSWEFDRLWRRYQARCGKPPDFSAAYWTPPLPGREAFEVERRARSRMTLAFLGSCGGFLGGIIISARKTSRLIAGTPCSSGSRWRSLGSTQQLQPVSLFFVPFFYRDTSKLHHWGSSPPRQNQVFTRSVHELHINKIAENLQKESVDGEGGLWSRRSQRPSGAVI